MDFHSFRSIDADFHLIAFDANDGNAHVITDRDDFTQLPC
jgi:hypothetical protein